MDNYSHTPQTDEHGNPIHHGHVGHETGVYGAATGTTGHHEGKLHRSGSSSSSSSEDDGQGGRRKKGIKDKIKDKLPGKQHNDQTRPAATTTTATHGGHTECGGGAHEKKGMVDKIKEKLPGHHE